MKFKIFSIVIVLFLFVEIFTKTILFNSSKDLRRFKTFPEKLAGLKIKKSRAVFIGNSLTERGINTETLEQELAGASLGGYSVDLFVADGSKINTWYYMINRYFWKEDLNPELMIVLFYENNLADGNALELGRLAQFFTGRADWSEIFHFEVTDPGLRLEFGVSSVWATYAVRNRIRERILGAVVPGYKETTTQVNGINVRLHQRGETPKPTQRTYSTLKRLLERGKQHHNRFCFVAFPTISEGKRNHYPVDPEMVALIKASGMEFIDMRLMPELAVSHYVDDIHLSPEGAMIYTKAFSQQLRAILAPSTDKP